MVETRGPEILSARQLSDVNRDDPWAQKSTEGGDDGESLYDVDEVECNEGDDTAIDSDILSIKEDEVKGNVRPDFILTVGKTIRPRSTMLLLMLTIKSQ